MLYLDASLAIHVYEAEDPRAPAWFDASAASGAGFVSSRLLQTELSRYLVRFDLPIRDREVILDHVDQMPITERIMSVADLMSPKLKALDAIHVASAIVSGATAIATHDRQMKAAAEVVALAVIDPLADM